MPPSPESTGQPPPPDQVQKVQLDQLVFTLSWEDPEIDRAAFGGGGGLRLATVGSGGCNALTFLLDRPAGVLAFDYNPTQVYVLQLKVAAFRHLDHAGLLELFGVSPSSRREALLAAAAESLPDPARAFWAAQPWLVSDGLLGGGRYERFIARFRSLLRLVQGRRRISALFEDRDAAGRAAFFDRQWNRWPWRLLFKAFFNKTVLARRGLSPDYFVFDDGSRSFAESFANRAARAMRDLPVRDNPFLARYLLGHYLDGDHLPEYLRPENVERIKAHLEALDVRVGDVRTVFDDLPEASLDGICLSNVFELMSEAETADVLARVARALRPGGRMTLRNLMVPRAAPPALGPLLTLEAELSRRLHAADRSFVYRSFQVYTRSHRRS
jgi:S-adenosylmethionine-diacylglycerol 3-amino-3-carboxypropyl transferase